MSPPAECQDRIDPRVTRTRACVLAAARAELIESGYTGTTIEAVAKRSGVARTTIYRHWPTRAQLVAEAFADVHPDPPDAVCASSADDLLALMLWLRDALETSNWGHMLPTLVDGASRDAELSSLQATTCHIRRERVTDSVQAALERGDLRPGTDPSAVVDQLTGPLFYRHLIRRQPTDDAYVKRLIAAVLRAHSPCPESAATPPDRNR